MEDLIKNFSSGWVCLILASLAAAAPLQPALDPMDSWLEAIRNVGPEGTGNKSAAAAWQHLSQRPAQDITRILAGMDGAGPLAVNWLASAADAITQRTLNRDEPLPLHDLGQFLLDIRHHPRARFLAFQLISQKHPAAAQQLVPGLLSDPGIELRRLAVQHLIDQAVTRVHAEEIGPAVLLYRQALHFARDVDQIQHIHDALKQQNQEVNLPKHFGFLMDWQVIGPFDNSSRRGFTTLFPPESRIEMDAEYPGKTGPVRWKRFTTTHQYGLLDFNKAYDYLKEVTAYAYSEFFSETARPAELRLGCKNAWKVWCNGQLLFGRDEYHRGMQIDQYRMPIQLQPGKNTILIKICQNEQTEDWTREWQFQIRVCDVAGTAILSEDRGHTSTKPSSPTEQP